METVNGGRTSESCETALTTKSPTICSEGVRKVATNRCHGGFGLSDAGYHAYAARKVLTLYPARDGCITTYWTAPESDRSGVLEGAAWDRATDAQRRESDAVYERLTINARDIARDDPDLVAVIEQLGAEANGDFARLHDPEGNPIELWEPKEPK